MKKTYLYTADIGSLRIGNNGFRACYGNGVGDGVYEVSVIDRSETKGLYFITTFYGEDTINVYRYDCESDNDVLFTLVEGRYALYRDEDGNMFIEKWEE